MRLGQSVKAVVASAVLAAALQLRCGPGVDGAETGLQGLEGPEEQGLLEQASVEEDAMFPGHAGDWWNAPDGALGALAEPETPVVMPEGDPQVRAQGWSPWVSLGVRVNSDPAACSPGRTLQVYLFMRGPENQLYMTFRDLSAGGGFVRPWKNLGGRLAGSPAAVCQVTPDGRWRFDVYAQGTDQGLHHLYGTAYRQSGWENLGGLMAGMTGPAAAIHPTSRQDVFVHWQDGGLRHKFFQGAWSGWVSPLAATIRGDPAAVYSASNRLDVVAVFSDGRVRHAFQENGVWQPWTTLPAAFNSSPELVSTGPGEMHLFARAPDLTLVHMRYVNGVWGKAESLGGSLTSGPGATVYFGGRIMVFARGADGLLWYRAWAP